MVQIRQAEKLSEPDAITSFFDTSFNQAISAAGENPMRAYAKLCGDEDLTDEDVMILHSLYLSRHMMALGAEVRANAVGNDNSAWRRVAASNLPLIIATEQGCAWWEARKHSAAMMKVAESSAYYTNGCDYLGPEISALKLADMEFKARRRKLSVTED